MRTILMRTVLVPQVGLTASFSFETLVANMKVDDKPIDSAVSSLVSGFMNIQASVALMVSSCYFYISPSFRIQNLVVFVNALLNSANLG